MCVCVCVCVCGCTWFEADERDAVLSIQLPLSELHLHLKIHQTLEEEVNSYCIYTCCIHMRSRGTRLWQSHIYTYMCCIHMLQSRVEIKVTLLHISIALLCLKCCIAEGQGSYALRRCMNIYKAHMSPALTKSSLRRQEYNRNMQRNNLTFLHGTATRVLYACCVRVMELCTYQLWHQDSCLVLVCTLWPLGPEAVVVLCVREGGGRGGEGEREGGDAERKRKRREKERERGVKGIAPVQ